MFSGIVETTGRILDIRRQGSNIDIDLECPFAQTLKIDQSIAHDGVCLTVVKLDPARHCYTVTAVQETLDKTNLGDWRVGSLVNLERSMTMGERLDGHIVQGHVDQTAQCSAIQALEGSHYFSFSYEQKPDFFTVEKGSVAVNGISLTVVNSKPGSFQVAIIPYTFANTNFHVLKVGDRVNLEFDILGKYIARIMAPYMEALRQGKR